MVAVEHYNQHHDPFIHHRHGIVDLNFNIIHIHHNVVNSPEWGLNYSTTCTLVAIPIKDASNMRFELRHHKHVYIIYQ